VASGLGDGLKDAAVRLLHAGREKGDRMSALNCRKTWGVLGAGFGLMAMIAFTGGCALEAAELADEQASGDESTGEDARALTSASTFHQFYTPYPFPPGSPSPYPGSYPGPYPGPQPGPYPGPGMGNSYVCSFGAQGYASITQTQFGCDISMTPNVNASPAYCSQSGACIPCQSLWYQLGCQWTSLLARSAILPSAR